MRRIQRSLSLLTVVILMAAGAAGCASTSIQKVLADPSRYRDREVTISGNVVNSFSVVGRGIYHVEDDTGSLWVVSDHGVPRKGARVSTTGTIRGGIDLGPLGDMARIPSGGVILVEREHKVR